MRQNIRSLVHRAFFPTALVAGTATVLFVSYSLSAVIGIRGLYALIGLCIGCVIYYGYQFTEPADVSGPALRWANKSVYLITLAAVVVAHQTDHRLLVLVVALPLGYLLVVYQLLAGATTRVALPQAISLFLISPVTKYLTLGFYFSGGDTLFHVHHIERLLTDGSVMAISGEYIGHGLYSYFPGLHLFIGSLSSITGLDAYGALLAGGTLVYGVLVILLLYVFARVALQWSRVALYVALSATLLYPLSYFATYFFPQALAVPLLIFVIYIGFRATASQNSRPLNWTATGLLVMGSAVFTHHLSFILLTPIITILALLPIAVSVFRDREFNRDSLFHPQIFPLVAGWIAAVTYWTVAADSFIINFSLAIRSILEGFLIAESSSEAAGFIAFGTTVPEQTVETAVLNLLSVNSLYLLSMTAVYAIGLAFLLQRYPKYRHSLSVILLAVLAAPIVFKTPFVFPGLSRSRMPFAFFFPLVFGLGLYRLVRSTASRPALRVVPVIVFVLLAATTPLFVWAGDDLYQIHDPPNGPPQGQVEFSESEMESFQELNQFKRSHGIPIQTAWVDALAIERYGGTSVGRATVDNGTLRAENGYLLYRDSWTDHPVVFDFESGKILISEEWLRAESTTNNKMYDSGQHGILWKRDEVVLGSS